MKIRTDFVTNSSSSSFIFGEPGKNTTDKKKILKLINDIKVEVLAVATKADEIKNKKKSITKRRDNVHKIIANNIQSELNLKILNIKDIENIVHDILMYDSETEFKFISDFPYGGEIIDLRQVDERNKKDAGKVIDAFTWYAYESKYDDKNSVLFKEYMDSVRNKAKSTKDHLKTAHNCLGEILMWSDDSINPWYMARILSRYCKYACNHMG